MNKEELSEFKERAKNNGFFTASENSEFYIRMFEVMERLDDKEIIGKLAEDLVRLMEKELALKDKALSSIDNFVNVVGNCFIVYKKASVTNNRQNIK